MRYLSTRGAMAPAGFREILLEGLAPDGGLAMPDHYPQVDRSTLARWRGLDYRSLAFEILSLFIDDIPPPALRAIVDRSYRAEVFGSDAVTPLTTLQPGLHLLHLSNGPTLAFKDVAMQLLGNLFEFVLDERGESLNILGATSGDTGSAAEYAMRGKRGIRVFMLSPHGAMSPFQTAQMFSLMDPNIHNIAIRGVFDDCQDIVKAVSADLVFKARYRIGTVNSINWARLVAQVVYYFKGYFAATRSDDEAVSFCVPSGNFGNICAGHVARRMGLPVHRLILATNENNVLDEFFRTGIYRPRSARETRQTSSPSMDISKASNFERYVYDLVGCDGARVSALWREIEQRGAFDLAATGEFAQVAATGFVSGHSTHADRLRTIRSIRESSGRIVDTHTADGLKVALELREAGENIVCLETALPVKFEATIIEALGYPPVRPAGFEALEAAPRRFDVMEADTAAVKRYIEGRCAGA
jgi:threonine synthase